MTERDAALDDALLTELERMATEFARIAGAEIVAARQRTFSVSYKDIVTGEVEPDWTDPVTEVDRDVENIVRSRLADHFPDHAVIGEEVQTEHRAHDFVWAIDPIDGTANFVNGFPLFAASIGLLHKGRPIVGALWCSATHALKPGIYHARDGGALSFDGQPLQGLAQAGVRRRLIGLPGPGATGPFDMRKSGSAAIECAYVAAGLMAAARFAHSNLWDVAGGVALVQAAGGAVLEKEHDAWRPFERFRGTSQDATDPAGWTGDLILAHGRETADLLGQIA